MRVALIGVGHWHAAMHLRSLQLVEEVSIVGVAAAQLDIAQAFAAESEGRPFTDYREMLAATKPDFVLAMGRPVDLPEIGIDLINAGIPCALEKPVGIMSADVAPLVQLARERKAFVAVPFTNRYSAMWTQLEQLENENRVGLRSHAHFRIINGPPQRYVNDGVGWMLETAVSGGGSLRNLGIHAADAFLQFVNGEAVEVLGATISHQLYGLEVEEFGAALLRSASGVIGTIEAGYTLAAMNGSDFSGRVAAANCTLIDHGDTLFMATLDDGQSETRNVPNQAARYDQFCVDTIERLRNGRSPIATIEDCYRAMALIDDIYRSAIVAKPQPKSGH